MLLTEFFNTPEGDSYANIKATPTATQAKRPQAAKRVNMVAETTRKTKVAEDSWSGPNNAWSDGQGQWHDGVDQWHGDDNGMFGGGSGATASSGTLGAAASGSAADAGKNAAAELDEESNPTDTVTMDIPLVIRMLEYAREDAKSDMELHKVTERMIALGANGQTLTMDDYNKICGIKE